jgi:hypothetical protein
MYVTLHAKFKVSYTNYCNFLSLSISRNSVPHRANKILTMGHRLGKKKSYKNNHHRCANISISVSTIPVAGS